MNLAALTYVLCCTFLVSSCTKTSEKKVPPPPADTWTQYTVPAQPDLKVAKVTLRYLYEDGSTYTSSTEFEYDDLNRLTSVRDIENNLVKWRFIYSGNNLVAELLPNDETGELERYDSTITFSRTGDSITLTYDFDGVEVSLLNVFNDSAIAQTIFSEKQPNEATAGFQRKIRVYGADANLKEINTVTSTSPMQTEYTVWETDNRKNFFRYVTRFMQWVWPTEMVSAMGRNNVTRIRLADGSDVQFSYKYNNEGFPLTVTSSDPANYPNIEIEYKQ